jgi:hypothetical protein
MRKLILLLSIIVLSCTEGRIFDDDSVDFASFHVETPVVLSQFTTDSVFFLTIGTTLPAFTDSNESRLPLIENATIENLESGITKYLYPCLDKPSQYIADIDLEEGETFRISLKFPEISEKQIKATDTIPFSSEIVSMTLIPEAKEVDNSLLTLVRLLIKPSSFQKVSNYEISVSSQITDSLNIFGFPLDSSMKAPSFRYLHAEDPLITREVYYPSLLQFDALPLQKLYFSKVNESETFEIEFYYTPPDFSIADITTGESIYKIYSHTSTVYLRTISDAYYKYQTSRLNQFYSRKGDPLYGVGEPVSIFSNIENGTGIFAAYVTDSIKADYVNK